MFIDGDVNPLNVFGLRQLDHCPPHFEKFEFDLRVSPAEISSWIYQHLEGRFWIGDTYTASASGTITMQKAVAFEKHNEVSYFVLFLDTINVQSFNLY